MTYLWATLLVILNLAWLSLVLFQFPGNWLMVATTGLVAWWQWEAQMIGLHVLAMILVLAAVGETLELIAGMRGAKKAGGNWVTSIGVILGAIVGAAVGTAVLIVVGTLIGVCLGACLGAWLVELARGKRHEHAWRVGVGAGVGQLVGTLSKLACGLCIWAIVAVAAFWP